MSSAIPGVGCGTILFFIFLVLKLTGFIAWSWWYVSAPIWAPLVVGFSLLGLGLAIKAWVES